MTDLGLQSSHFFIITIFSHSGYLQKFPNWHKSYLPFTENSRHLKECFNYNDKNNKNGHIRYSSHRKTMPLSHMSMIRNNIFESAINIMGDSNNKTLSNFKYNNSQMKNNMPNSMLLNCSNVP